MLRAIISQHGFCRGKVGWCVYADCRLFGKGHTDFVAGLEPPQLLKAFGKLERRLWQSGYAAEHFHTVAVKPDMGKKSHF